MSKILKMFAVVVAIFAGALVLSPGVSAAAPAKAPAMAVAAQVMAAPKGCPSGATCLYNRGNGGDLCGIYYGNAASLGGCTNKAWSVYNHGTTCSGCQDVNLYWGSSYTGAWYCLPKGSYLLYLDLNTFNRGQGKSGFGQAMSNNIASLKWTGC
jgi:hypothetical protein